MKVSIAVLVVLAFVSGCQTVDGVGRYRVESVGNSRRTVEAKIVASRPIFIAVEASGAGSLLGGAVGAGLTAKSDNAAVIFTGIIGGIIVGNAVESAANVHKGTEYTLQTFSEATLTVAQINSGNRVFKVGEKVTLVYGFPCSLIPAQQ